MIQLRLREHLLFAIFLLALLLAGTGCELSVPATPPPTTGGNGGNQDTGEIKLSVTPSVIQLLAGGAQQFQAVVIGTSQTSVRWEMVSGEGSISATGLYTAPTVVGTDTLRAVIRALLLADTSKADSAVVKIVKRGDTLAPGEVCFETEVLPIFRSSCAMSGCHDAVTYEKEYLLTNYEGIMKGIVPGDANESEIYEKIIDTRPKERMPPLPRGRLTDAQLEVIRKWIEQGARNTSCSGGGVCDTVNVTYSSTIRPIIENNCLGCHNGPSPDAGLNLSTWSGVQGIVANGRLLPVIQHAPNVAPMPKGGARLPDCDIAKIVAWVNNGSLNN